MAVRKFLLLVYLCSMNAAPLLIILKLFISFQKKLETNEYFFHCSFSMKTIQTTLNQIRNVHKKGQFESVKNNKECMKRLERVEKANECQDRCKWTSAISDILQSIF